MTAASLMRIVVSATLLSGLIAALLITPFARETYAAHIKQRDELRYATGLSPCDEAQTYFVSRVDGDLPGPPDISIDAFHTFSAPEALRIVGEDIFFFRVTDRLDPDSGFDIYRSTLSNDASQAFASELEIEITKAHERTSSGDAEIAPVDGSTYYFRQGESVKCGFARMPKPGSRAQLAVDLYNAFVDHTTASAVHPVSEDQLRSRIKALKEL